MGRQYDTQFVTDPDLSGPKIPAALAAMALLDAIAWPAELIRRLYGHRWNIETCFNSVKTHTKMNALKCKDVAGVIKELIMYLMVWNLVREWEGDHYWNTTPLISPS